MPAPKANLTLRYGRKDWADYERVLELAEQNTLSRSAAGKLLIKRGLRYRDKSEPIVKTVVKEVPVEKVVKEIVYRDPPKEGKSTPNPALGVKKSRKEKNGIGGWIALGGVLALIFGPVVHSWFTK